MENAFKLSVDNDGVASLVFDLPGEKVNKFTAEVMLELEKVLDEAAQNKNIKIMTISSGKEDIFIAGADLHSFEPIFKDPSQGSKIISTGHRIFNKLENLPFPTVALIQGACLGGGTEMALACTYRVVSDSPKTAIGLPEVTLGIIPGWGGTQRMPRLVGLMEGLPIILGGKSVKANKAAKIKLADAIYAPAFFNEGVSQFLKQCLSSEGARKIKDSRKRHGLSSALLEKNPIGRAFIFNQAEKDIIKRTKGHYPAPLVALNLIKDTYTLPLKQGLLKEEKSFVDNLDSKFKNAPNLIHLFFISEALKKDKGVAGDVKPLKVSSAGVIGSGTMGSGIAWLLSNQNIPVRMKDIDWNALAKGFGTASSLYYKAVKDKRMKAGEASLKFHQITGTTDYSGFKDLDIVIEAAVESLELKHKILKELEEVLRPDAIIASNTSSLKISDMGSVLKHPERFVGMHFFNPANKMPLVEVVASDKTSPEAIVTAVDLCRKLGKTPIVVRDCPGFLVNRVFVTGANEIIRMYQEGVSQVRLDKMMLDFGMPMAPFALADEVGNDVGYKVSKIFEESYGSRMEMPKILSLMYENKLFGKKTGKGFYLYEGDSTKVNPEVE
ncbi:MAG TPA: 3-hydroxyacyl-CoA dehydrogenase NAD-binding domain-containing protein, partial [Parachlamydiaceae bacterium]|nr:3-hydroxyacyl-CoA dehydrogenase NAD-binding domain-containing protein [Parachlamydiaceae bacterium]